jgi:hypothetical protein
MNGFTRKTRNDYDLSEWADSFIEEDTYQDYEDEEEDLLLDEWKKSSLPKDIYYRYAQDVAWVGEYSITRFRNVYKGKCERCNKTFTHRERGRLKGMIESHILRGCKDPKYAPLKYEEDPPF